LGPGRFRVRSEPATRAPGPREVRASEAQEITAGTMEHDAFATLNYAVYRPTLPCGHVGWRSDYEGVNDWCDECAREKETKQREDEARKQRAVEEEREQEDVSLVERFLAGDVKSASLKKALHAWLRNAQGAPADLEVAPPRAGTFWRLLRRAATC